MSNHLHVVVEMHADIAADWSAEAVAERWLGLVAVGTPVARRPPHRSVRAALPHTAPA